MRRAIPYGVRVLTIPLLLVPFGGCTALFTPLFVVGSITQNWGINDLTAVSFTPLSDNLSGTDTRIIAFKGEEEEFSWDRKRDLFAVVAVERDGITVTGSKILYERSPEGFPFRVLARITVKNETNRQIELPKTSVAMDLRRRKDWRQVKLDEVEILPSAVPDSIASSQSILIPSSRELKCTLSFDYDAKSARSGRYRFDLRDAQTGEVFRYQFDAVRAK